MKLQSQANLWLICIALAQFSVLSTSANEEDTVPTLQGACPFDLAKVPPLPHNGAPPHTERDDIGFTNSYFQKYFKYNVYSLSLRPISRHARYKLKAVRTFRGALYLANHRQDYRSAAHLFMKAYNQDNSMLCAAYNAGISYERVKNYDKAITSFESLAGSEERVPEDLNLFSLSQNHLAKIYLIKHDRKKASRYVSGADSFGSLPKLENATVHNKH